MVRRGRWEAKIKELIRFILNIIVIEIGDNAVTSSIKIA